MASIRDTKNQLEIHRCPVPGVRNLDSLRRAITEGRRPMAPDQASTPHLIELPELHRWDWDQIAFAIEDGKLMADAVDSAIHRSLR